MAIIQVTFAPRYVGLSSDIKPTDASVVAGSMFTESDTGLTSVYTGASWSRVPTAFGDPNLVAGLLANMDATLTQMLMVLQGTLGH